MTNGSKTVRDLRRQWKPHKDRLAGDSGGHPTAIRFHRACSWLGQAELLDTEDADVALIQQWIALNALNGRWNDEAREPVPDRVALRQFLETILSLDASGYIRTVFVDNKRLVLTILRNAHINRHFWQQPTQEASDRCGNAGRRAQSWYVEGRWLVITEQLLERIYLLRCQLIHGAATRGSHISFDVTDDLARVIIRPDGK